MRIKVKLIAIYREFLPPGTTGNTAELDVEDDATIESIMNQLGVPVDDTSVIVLNGLTVPLDTHPSAGDTITAFSAVAGG